MSSNSEPVGPVPDRGPATFAVTTATLVLASVFVFARLVTRQFIVKNVTWDDRVMGLAWLVALFLSFTICLGVSNGLGKRDEDIPVDQVPILRRCEYVFSILYNPALMAAKSSILIFYLRLSKNTQKVLRVCSWATIAIVNIAGTVLTFMNIFQCKPTEAGWNSDFHGSTRCIPLLTEFICSAPVNIVTDLVILALPIPVLTGMRLPSRQKTILVLTFALGIFVTVVDVIRIYYLQQGIANVPTGITSDPRSRFGGQVDFAYNAASALMWSAVEVNITLTCACIPTLKPLVVRLLPTILYDPNGSRTRNSHQSGDSKGGQECHTRTSTPSLLEGLTQPEPTAQVDFAGVHTASIDPNAPVTAMEFLTTPDMQLSSERTNSASEFHRARTQTTMSTNISRESGIYFGFVNMTKPKSMLRADNRESLKYCTIVSILFLLWGVSYGLLNTLNGAVAAVNHMTTAETIGLTSAYFGGGYFFGPLLIGEWILRRDEHSRTRRERNGSEYIGGYKATFIIGLCIYGVGTIIFWPSAVTGSFGGFMLSNFVVGFGLSVLEVAANSFMVLCGPPQYSETRLLVAQAVQGVGSVLSGLLAQKVFFKSLSNADPGTSAALINVQWTYLGITLLCVVLALFFYYMPLPEVSDGELEASTRRLTVNPCKKSVGGVQLRTISLCLAVMCQYIYVGCQESNSTFFQSLLMSVLPGQPSSGLIAASGVAVGANAVNPAQPPGLAMAISDYLIVGHTAFAIGRFIAALFTYLSVKNVRMPQPRTVLAVSIFFCFLFSLLCVVLQTSNPNILFIPSCLFFLFEGPIWPLVFAIGLRGQGRRTKRAAAYITMGASGPAFLPFVIYGIITRGGTVQMAFLFIAVLQVLMILFPLFLISLKDARAMVDTRTDKVQGEPEDEGERRIDGGFAEAARPRRSSATLAEAGVSEKSHWFLQKVSKSFSAKGKSSRGNSSPILEVEHSEGNAGDSS